MSVAKWLARQRPKGAVAVRLFVQGEPHTSWLKDSDELADYAAFARSIEELGEDIAEESGTQVAMRVAWFDKRDKELPAGYSWTIGYSQGQALADGSANASAVNAQRHLEAVMRVHVQSLQTQAKHQAALIDGFKMLADTARGRAVESDAEARMLRGELRAYRERERELEGIAETEDDGPSALDSALDKLSPEARDHVGALVVGTVAHLVQGFANAASGGGSAAATNTGPSPAGDQAPTDSTSDE